MTQKQLTQKDSYEKYERNAILFLLFLFIISGVLFLSFLAPYFYKNYSIASPNETKNNDLTLIDKNKNTPEVNYKTGRDFLNQNNYSSALNYFEAAVKTDPNNIDYLTELAITHYRLKNYQESIKAYEKIISLDGDNASAYLIITREIFTGLLKIPKKPNIVSEKRLN